MNFLSKFDQFIFDLDGVVYIEDKTTYKAPEVFKHLRNQNKNILFITNNPTRSPFEYRKKLKELNIYSKLSEMITSPMAVRYYLTKKYKNLNKKSAYIIGSKYLKKEINSTGIQTLKGKKAYFADIVIMGGHNKFNFDEIKTATLAIRNGADFIATNKDYVYPSKDGPSPATGSLLISIETSAEKKAEIIGKPEKHIFELIKDITPFKKKRTLFIGDSLDTDIEGGNKAGFKTALTLTGNTKRNMLKKSVIKPDYVIDNLSELIT